MSHLPQNENARGQAGEIGKARSSARYGTPPKPTGQRAQVFNAVKKRPGILSFVLTADMAIPEAAARIHDLRCMGFNIITTILPTVVFRGVERRNVASYHLGSPAWPRPGFFEGK